MPDGVRDRTGPEPLMLTSLLTGQTATPRDELVQDETTPRYPSSSKAWWSLGEHWPGHRVGNLGSGVRLPRALRAIAQETVVTEDGPHPPVKVEPSAPRCVRVILTGRATSVPFTAVSDGDERTTTDNARTASTSVIPQPRR